MTDIEFSEWYFLFLTPVNNQTANTDLTQKTRASAARELTESLSRKLKVQTSEFRIISIEEYAVGKHFNSKFSPSVEPVASALDVEHLLLLTFMNNGGILSKLL